MLRSCVAVFFGLSLLVGCGGGGQGEVTEVVVDGSSTVLPISEAVAEEYRSVAPTTQVTVSKSGTGGGFKKFVDNRSDINDASRPIKPSEQKQAKEAGIGFIELPVAYDGISVVVNPENDFVDFLTVDDLRRIWEPNSAVQTWQDVRPEWPAETIELYGPGPDSGTFDYFTDAIVGESGRSRSDYTASEDDNVLVTGVAGDTYSLGYFGYAYYAENQNKLKAVAVKPSEDAEPVEPSMDAISSGRYRPLSRPIFIYVSTEAAKKPQVASFVDFYLDQAPALVPSVKYVPLPEEAYELVRERWQKRITGTAFADAQPGKGVVEVLSGQSAEAPAESTESGADDANAAE